MRRHLPRRLKIKTQTDIIKPKINNTIKESDIKIDTSKPLIALCCCGYAPSSLRYTVESIKKNIIDILKPEFNIDIYTYSYISKNNIFESNDSKIHGTSVNNKDAELLGNNIVSIYQEDVSDTIKNILINKNIKLRDISIVNFIRGLLMEKDSFNHIMNSNKNYKSIIYVHPDMFISKPISVTEIYNTINESKSLYTTSFNDLGGYGTGFYIGNPNVLSIITSRIDQLDSITKIEPEKLLKICVTKSNITRYNSSMFHFKVRINGKPDVYYQLLKKYTNTKEYMATMLLFKESVRKTITKSSPKPSSKPSPKPIMLDDNVNLHDKKSKRRHKRRSCPR